MPNLNFGGWMPIGTPKCLGPPISHKRDPYVSHTIRLKFVGVVWDKKYFEAPTFRSPSVSKMGMSQFL